MAQFARSLDIYQGFNFKRDKQAPVGFITSLQIGDGEAFPADQETIKDPLGPGDNHDPVVGVLNHFLWETGTTDAFYMSAQVSTSNKQHLSELLFGTWTHVEVTFNVVIYEYDPKNKSYFKSMWADQDLQGVLEKNGDDLNLSVADNPSSEVQSPLNFTMQIGIKPAPLEQSVNMATGQGKTVVKQWGVTEAAA
ncbi:MAG TPA: hypothetical protein VK458_31065 [Myxococcaceae bacterium]|jgi:hypothetical protein|nr:hypothetical protein [Myxococcaceae bacterium]